jgi:hypothetical protein
MWREKGAKKFLAKGLQGNSLFKQVDGQDDRPKNVLAKAEVAVTAAMPTAKAMIKAETTAAKVNVPSAIIVAKSMVTSSTLSTMIVF